MAEQIGGRAADRVLGARRHRSGRCVVFEINFEVVFSLPDSWTDTREPGRQTLSAAWNSLSRGVNH